MRRLGTLLMIIGANLIVGSIAIGFYIAALGCAIGESDAMCSQGTLGVYADLMTSKPGIIFWALIAGGIYAFWRGKRMRANPDRPEDDTPA